MCELVTLENGSSVFICNCTKKDHECNEEASILLLVDGSRIKNTSENVDEYLSQIVGGSVCCSTCGRAAIDNAPYL